MTEHPAPTPPAHHPIHVSRPEDRDPSCDDYVYVAEYCPSKELLDAPGWISTGSDDSAQHAVDQMYQMIRALGWAGADEEIPVQDDSGLLDKENEGPEEGDYVLTPCGNLGSKIGLAIFGITWIGEYPDEDTAYAVIHDKQHRDNIYTDVWFRDDHGGMNLRTEDFNRWTSTQ